MPVTAHKLADGRYECQNCLRKFSKNPKYTQDPKFCQKACCDEFHLNGGFSLKKMESKIRRWIRDEFAVIQAEEEFQNMVRQIALEVLPVKKRRAA